MDIIPTIEIPKKKFRIAGETIHFKKKTYPLQSVRHLYYQKTRIIQKTNFVKSGEAMEAVLSLILDDGKEVTIDIDERTIFHGLNSDKSHEISNLEDVFMTLMDITREIRGQKYFDEVNELGFFRYGTIKFYPKEKIVNGKKEYILSNYKVLKSGRSILLRNKNEDGIWQKIKNYFDKPSFEMVFDPDIAFFMLEKFYGWKWKSN